MEQNKFVSSPVLSFSCTQFSLRFLSFFSNVKPRSASFRCDSGDFHARRKNPVGRPRSYPLGDNIDSILLNIQKEEAKNKEIHIEDNVLAPSPRSNCLLTINPLKETELILYGGEFYNGNKTFVYGDLYRYDVEKQEWKLISSPNSPPPRSAHQVVAWENYLYIYGGEFTSPNQERFQNYKDFWVCT